MLLRIRDKIKKIEDYIDILQEMRPDCKSKINTDKIYYGAIMHYLYSVSDSCISLAEMVIKMKDFKTASSYYDAIDILGDKGVIPADFAYDFAKIASFRNFLAHDYEKVNLTMICEEILAKLGDIKKYLQFIKNSI